MSLHSYLCSQALSTRDIPFSALIMAALRKADTSNAARLDAAFPDICDEMRARYNAPGGILGEEITNQEDYERFKHNVFVEMGVRL